MKFESNILSLAKSDIDAMLATFHFAMWLVFCFTTIPIGTIIGITLYRHIKNQEHLEKGKVIQRIMKTFVLVQCITWPTLMVWNILLGLNKSIQIIPPSWMSLVVFTTRVINNLHYDYVAFHSLVIAVCRYSFIVYKDQAEKIGIKKLRTLFISSTVLVPCFRQLLFFCTWKSTDSRFLSAFVYFDDETTQNSFFNTTHTNRYHPGMITDSILYVLVNDHFPSMLVFAIKFTSRTMLILIYSNIPEGLIYLHTFYYSRR